MKIWDWKYKIFFDDKVKEELRLWEQKLSSPEVAVYNEVEAFYLSFYSFGILFDQILAEPTKIDEYIEKANANKHLIIKTPAILIKHFKRQIKKSIHDEKQAKKLLNLLELSRNGKDISDEYWQLAAKIFGSLYQDIVSEFTKNMYAIPFHKFPRQKNIEGNCNELFTGIFTSLINDPYLAEKFGSSAINTFTKQIVDGNGYGEWWDKEISDSGNDELILYTNDNKVKSDDYKYTIIHETYPGHGHFYNYVAKGNSCLDHGAMELIEGWATYCEWNTYPSKYVDAIKHNALHYLYQSYHLSIDDFTDSIVKRNQKKRRPFKNYVYNLIYSTQYIGYIESYYLGALWLEKIFDSQRYSPKSFLEHLSKTNKGLFFRLWQ